MEHFDVVIVGAGISGIGASCHLKTHCPSKRYVVLEGRADIGGTWDLFQYPGVRSDSDMYTLGYGFKPWTQTKTIADGPEILRYLREVVRDYGVEQHMRFDHHVVRANWSSSEARWTVDAVQGAAKTPIRFTCNFLFMGTGYYDYAQGYLPDFPGREDFGGKLVHPQFWTQDIDYANKHVIVIGSGATAVTIVPEIAKRAAHVTMLQRSPSYLISTPAIDPFASVFRKYLPQRLAYILSRWRNVLEQQLFITICKYRPQMAKKILFGKIFNELGPDFDYERHFTPRYNPWEQRLCIVPDSDFFLSLKSGRASIVTDRIDRFTQAGIRLKSGTELKADLIVSATGLKLLSFGGVAVSVDGVAVDVGQKVVYKGMMYNDVPNLAISFGYSNASWTLRADLTCAYVCRLLNHMDKTGTDICIARLKESAMPTKAWIDLSSGYFERAKDILPKQGEKSPWTLSKFYTHDRMMMNFGKVDDGVMEFAFKPSGDSTSTA